MTSIRALGVGSGRSGAEGCSSARSSSAAVAPVGIEQVEEALVACHELWRRSPGAGKWPFAGDGPWHLIQGELGDVGAAEFSETILVTDAGRELRVRKVDSLAPRTPLDAGEVATRDRVTAWLQWVADPLDRRLVWLATGALARGESRVPWVRLRARLRSGLTPEGLARRYRKGLALVVCRLNGWPTRRAKALLARDGLVAEPVQRAAMVVVGEEG